MEKEVLAVFSFVVIIAFIGLVIDQSTFSQEDITGEGIGAKLKKAVRRFERQVSAEAQRAGLKPNDSPASQQPVVPTQPPIPVATPVRCNLGERLYNGKCMLIRDLPCQDSENSDVYGAYFNKGILSGELVYPDAGVVKSVVDQCMTSAGFVEFCSSRVGPCFVRDYYCDHNGPTNFKYVDFNCPKGCSNGACTESVW